MADDLQEMVVEPGLDRLVTPQNPLAPVAASEVIRSTGAGGAIQDFLSPPYAEANCGRRAKPSADLQDRMKRGVEHSIDWMKFPGQAAEGIKPEVPGQWSESDEFRKQSQDAYKTDWGIQTAVGTVFDPMPALAERIMAPAGSFALRNMRATPVDHDPFAATPQPGNFSIQGRGVPKITSGEQVRIAPDNHNVVGGHDMPYIIAGFSKYNPKLRVAKFEPFDHGSAQNITAVRNADGALLGTISLDRAEGGYRVIAESGPRSIWLNTLVPTLDEAKSLISRRYGIKMTPVEHDPFK